VRIILINGSLGNDESLPVAHGLVQLGLVGQGGTRVEAHGLLRRSAREHHGHIYYIGLFVVVAAAAAKVKPFERAKFPFVSHSVADFPGSFYSTGVSLGWIFARITLLDLRSQIANEQKTKKEETINKPISLHLASKC